RGGGDGGVEFRAQGPCPGVAAVPRPGWAGRGDWGRGGGRNRDQDRLARAERKLKDKWSARIAAVQAEVGGLLARAHACEAEGDRQGAEEIYGRLVARNPYNAEALHGAGMMEWRKGNLRPALDLLNRAAGLSASAAYYEDLGRVLEAAGQAQHARAAFARASELASLQASSSAPAGAVTRSS